MWPRRADGDIAGVISNDLQHSGLFAPIDQKAFIEKISNFDAAPRFGDWRIINAQALVTGQVVRQGDGRMRTELQRQHAMEIPPWRAKEAVGVREQRMAEVRPQRVRPCAMRSREPGDSTRGVPRNGPRVLCRLHPPRHERGA